MPPPIGVPRQRTGPRWAPAAETAELRGRIEWLEAELIRERATSAALLLQLRLSRWAHSEGLPRFLPKRRAARR